MLIFSILNHPLSFLVYYYFFSVFLSYQINICGFPHVNGCFAQRRKRLKISSFKSIAPLRHLTKVILLIPIFIPRLMKYTSSLSFNGLLLNLKGHFPKGTSQETLYVYCRGGRYNLYIVCMSYGLKQRSYYIIKIIVK